MNEIPPPRETVGHLAPPSDPSPPLRPRINDDLLANLTPRTVVDAFRTPTGSLKACIERASPAEQAFALRVAIASSNIAQWLEELSSWPWPSSGGSAGFEVPAAKRRKLSPSGTGTSDAEEYTGSLPTVDIAKYEKRIDEISQALDEIDMEEIKRQVLNNHIMPLSRPGTPNLGAARTQMSSLSAIARMDDLTAVITATTVQALPNLYKLTRLMECWSLRLMVLRRVPIFLDSLADAETALQSAWHAVERAGARHLPDGSSSPLTRAEYDVMKGVLERKVAKAGRDLDAMLDMLEGQPDTLPEDWIDRMDNLEREYGTWTVACEKKLKELELAALKVVERKSVENSGSDAPSESPKKNTDNHPVIIKIHPTEEGKGLDGSQDALDSDSIPDTDCELSDAEGRSSRSRARPSADSRRSSGMTESTVIHDPQTDMDSFSSEEPEAEYPEPACPPCELSSSFPPPPARSGRRSMSVSFNDKPTVTEFDSFPSPPGTPAKSDDNMSDDDMATEPNTPTECILPPADEKLQKKISEILQSVPAKIRLTQAPPNINLNPPDFKMPTARKSSKPDPMSRSHSNMSLRSAYSSRSATPSFTLAPAFTSRPSRSRNRNYNPEIKLYHLSRSNGEAPIKLFIRCVGEHGERVMVRVGGGWADLGEYLKEYAAHHLRRSGAASEPSKIEVKDVPKNGPVNASNSRRASTSSRPGPDSTPPSRPSSSLGTSPTSPLRLRKTRQRTDESACRPKTPVAGVDAAITTPPPSDTCSVSQSFSSSCSSAPRGPRSRPGSRAGARAVSAGNATMRMPWLSDDLAEEGEPVPLGMAGPKAKQLDMLSEEGRAWVETVKEKVRVASSGGLPSAADKKQQPLGGEGGLMEGFTLREMGKVGGTKRLFKKQG
ncbi:uncharacterized protein CTHT_0065400 [Thermochaetoides thermophila DSM 1495]|uniref:GAR domain-containing protein n=1 Tax=Chaetomium thermophilum (strain DSM 1495 / CBS 144.50 / IMI 039719) TaxID=759272 RepID=G0SG83_CHATD|nr:hypothetical protein CTHT_0065400 [Thermochaetoides thermophila DSM 1495]EGS17222.1 hypothetical protein CTHT_0065400 [Thermochaetoides thermophila DSM 1495]